MNETLRSTLRTLLIVVAAAAVLAAVIYGYVYVNEKPPAATGHVVKVSVYSIHSQMRLGAATQGLVGGLDTYDQLIVLADVEVRNQSKSPVQVEDMWGDLTPENGDQQRSLGAGKSVFEKVFVAYPQVPRPADPPILRDSVIQPGQSVRGTMIFHYPQTEQQWDKRQHFDVVMSFQNQANLVMRAPH